MSTGRHSRATSVSQLFAPKTWEDLRVETIKRLRYKWIFSSVADIEDAAADSVLRALDYWTDLASTRKVIESGDAGKLWNFATSYCYLYATELLVKRSERAELTVSIVDTDDDAHHGTRCIQVERVESYDDDRTRDEREDAMLARLLDKYGAPPEHVMS